MVFLGSDEDPIEYQMILSSVPRANVLSWEKREKILSSYGGSVKGGKFLEERK